MHTQKILAQLLCSSRSYSLPKSTTCTVVKSQFMGLQLSRQILSVCVCDRIFSGADDPGNTVIFNWFLSRFLS
jgi:hypothetical protein